MFKDRIPVYIVGLFFGVGITSSLGMFFCNEPYNSIDTYLYPVMGGSVAIVFIEIFEWWKTKRKGKK